MRDSQRQKVYDSECQPTGQRLPTVGLMQAYVDKILASAWARRRFGNRQVVVTDGRRRSRAGGGYGRMLMPKWTRDEATVLHELAHNLAGAAAWHGPEFTRVLLELVKHVHGDEEERKLRDSFRAHKVKVGPPLVLRSAERTPPAPADKTPKLWRVEFKAGGKLEQRDVYAVGMVHVLKQLVGLVGNPVLRSDANASNLRIWRGRETTKIKTAASRRQANKAAQS